jgi:hypothetical protein
MLIDADLADLAGVGFVDAEDDLYAAERFVVGRRRFTLTNVVWAVAAFNDRRTCDKI